MHRTTLFAALLACASALSCAEPGHPQAAAAAQQAATEAKDWAAAHPEEIAAAKQQAQAHAATWTAAHPEQVAQAQAKADQIMDDADLNGDGTISDKERQIAGAKAATAAKQQADDWAAAHPDEIANATTKAKQAQAKADSARTALDSDGSGAVTQDEWQASAGQRHAAARSKAAGRTASHSGGARSRR
jgi:hypothetical protein